MRIDSAIAATSSGRPCRPTRIRLAVPSFGVAGKIRVSLISAGASALTVTPSPATRGARWCTSPWSAALLAA